MVSNFTNADAVSNAARQSATCAAAGLSLAAALVHLWAAPGHLAEWWGYGAFFLAAALSQGIYAALLLRYPSRAVLLAGIGGNLALVSLYAITRTAGIPFFGPHAGEVHAAGALDLLCVAAELSLVVLLISLCGEHRRASLYLSFGALLSFGAGASLHALHAGYHEAHGADPLLHWLQGSLVGTPLAALVVWLSAALSGRLVSLVYGPSARGLYPRAVFALVAALAYALAGVPADEMAALHTGMGSFAGMAARDAAATLGLAFLLALFAASVRGAPWEEPRRLDLRRDLRRPRALAAAAGAAFGLAVLAGPAAFGALSPDEARAQAASPSCSSASYDRSYDVAAVNVEIPFNRFSDPNVAGEGQNIDPHGQVFVLQGDKAAVKNWWRPLAATPEQDPADNRRLRPRPLVIRANAGECVKVALTNELDAAGRDGLPNNPRVGMKVYGPAYDAQTSDGSAVGYNDDTTVGIGETISYYWQAPDEEGTFLFRDQGALAGSEANSGSTGHGLYGALVVEPAGSEWRDPETGRPLYAGERSHGRITKQSGDPYIDADIVSAGETFRETVQISQDELPGGNGFSFNYGAEPSFNRIATNPAGENELAGRLSPDAVGEETSLSSWTYGDPALIKLASGKGPWLPNGQRTNVEDCGLQDQPVVPGGPKGSCYVANVTHAYPGDPTKVRFAHAGVKETHVFHMHAHQWRVEPNDPGSQIIDSQTYGPGETFTAELIGGAGSKPKTIGDSIFHCHLYPHFADGFWALFRVHDVREDGTNKLPDGTGVRNLEPLPGGASPPAATAQKPGYPRFIPGRYGWRAPQPPKGISESNGQPDNPATVAREDLDPATRVVAGRPLDPAQLATRTDPVSQELARKLELEQDAMLPGAKPGAPFAEPCPAGSREVTYNVSVIQTDVVYNERGDHDTQGRVMVLTEDVPEILAGTKNPEPLFIRVNAGDCINYNLTNYLPNWIGGDSFLDIAQTNMAGGHIHLVKFDVLASDGSSNGWNYQEAAFTKEQAEFNEEVVAGTKSCDWQGCRIEDPATWDPTTKSGAAPGQTIHERWYADTELRTVFTHDHHFAALDQNRGYFGALIVEPRGMDFRNPRTGEFYQPGNGSAPGAPTCGSECTGTADGTAMDIIGPGPSDDFREFGLAIQDFVSLTRRGGNPANPADTINPPAAPEEFPDADPGTMAINYRNAPFQYRQERNGRPTDPAHVFSSTVHGDPMTPVFEAYSEDPVRIRAIQGSQEEQHVLSINGVRWREEPGDPNSPLINAKAIGISEAFNFEVPRITCGAGDTACVGDYLYGGTATDDLYLGAWGILRARGKTVPSLLPLPDNANPSEPTTGGAPTATSPSTGGSGGAPPEANTPGNPCPTGAPVRKYSVVAMQADIGYDGADYHDPHGLIYALASDEAAIRSGEKEPEPLVLRANEGDCIEVRLMNRLGQDWLQRHGTAGVDGDPTLPTEPATGTRAGLRVSLHPQVVQYDVRGSDGTAVGFNRDQTVAPGDSRLYRWYADDPGRGEIGATNLLDFGDVRGHRHHGLFAALNIEPRGSTYHDPATGDEIRSGASADIRVPGPNNDFREFSAFFQDGLNLRDAAGNPIEDPLDHPPTPEEPEGEPLDAEDQGEKGFNYASAPFEHRIGHVPETGMEGRAMADVFSSKVHGDPETPIFRAYAGDRIKMRVLQGSDKPRQHSWQVSGAAWKAQPEDPNSNLIGTQGGISVGRAFNVNLPAGFAAPGDYRYGCGVAFHHLSGGLWGMLRVYPKASPASMLNPTPIGEIDDPRAGGHPILPLELAATKTTASLAASPATLRFGGKTTLSGELSGAGGPLSNRQVVIEQRPAGASGFTALPNGRLTTGADGSFGLPGVAPKGNTEYRVRFAGAPGAGLGAATAVAPVKVRAVVSAGVAKPLFQLGGGQRISGSVKPAHSGKVRLTIKRGAKVVSAKSVPLKSSRFAFDYRPSAPGRYSVVASFAGDADHLGGASPRKTFRVVR